MDRLVLNLTKATTAEQTRQGSQPHKTTIGRSEEKYSIIIASLRFQPITYLRLVVYIYILVGDCRLVNMPKKKRKNGGQKDARGYSSTNVPSKPIVKSVPKKKGFGPSSSSLSSSITNSSTHAGAGAAIVSVAGKSKSQIKVSQRVQDEIISLLDKLKESLLASSRDHDDGDDDDESSKQPMIITPALSMDDKKTVKKIASLVRAYD